VVFVVDTPSKPNSSQKTDSQSNIKPKPGSSPGKPIVLKPGESYRGGKVVKEAEYQKAQRFKEAEQFAKKRAEKTRPKITKTTIIVKDTGEQVGLIQKRGKTEADIIIKGRKPQTIRGIKPFVEQEVSLARSEIQRKFPQIKKRIIETKAPIKIKYSSDFRESFDNKKDDKISAGIAYKPEIINTLKQKPKKQSIPKKSIAYSESFIKELKKSKEKPKPILSKKEIREQEKILRNIKKQQNRERFGNFGSFIQKSENLRKSVDAKIQNVKNKAIESKLLTPKEADGFFKELGKKGSQRVINYLSLPADLASLTMKTSNIALAGINTLTLTNKQKQEVKESFKKNNRDAAKAAVDAVKKVGTQAKKAVTEGDVDAVLDTAETILFIYLGGKAKALQRQKNIKKAAEKQAALNEKGLPTKTKSQKTLLEKDLNKFEKQRKKQLTKDQIKIEKLYDKLKSKLKENSKKPKKIKSTKKVEGSLKYKAGKIKEKLLIQKRKADVLKREAINKAKLKAKLSKEKLEGVKKSFEKFKESPKKATENVINKNIDSIKKSIRKIKEDTAKSIKDRKEFRQRIKDRQLTIKKLETDIKRDIKIKKLSPEEIAKKKQLLDKKKREFEAQKIQDAIDRLDKENILRQKQRQKIEEKQQALERATNKIQAEQALKQKVKDINKNIIDLEIQTSKGLILDKISKTKGLTESQVQYIKDRFLKNIKFADSAKEVKDITRLTTRNIDKIQKGKIKPDTGKFIDLGKLQERIKKDSKSKQKNIVDKTSKDKPATQLTAEGQELILESKGKSKIKTEPPKKKIKKETPPDEPKTPSTGIKQEFPKQKTKTKIDSKLASLAGASVILFASQNDKTTAKQDQDTKIDNNQQLKIKSIDKLIQETTPRQETTPKIMIKTTPKLYTPTTAIPILEKLIIQLEKKTTKIPSKFTKIPTGKSKIPPSIIINLKKMIKTLKKKKSKNKKEKFILGFTPTLAGIGAAATRTKGTFSGFEVRGSIIKPIKVKRHKRKTLKTKPFVRRHRRAKPRK
jgi:hypothetical protein